MIASKAGDRNGEEDQEQERVREIECRGKESVSGEIFSTTSLAGGFKKMVRDESTSMSRNGPKARARDLSGHRVILVLLGLHFLASSGMQQHGPGLARVAAGGLLVSALIVQ